jgi:hypothetical protein
VLKLVLEMTGRRIVFRDRNRFMSFFLIADLS